MLSTKIGEMKVELVRFMRETSQLVALDDYPAQVFLMESGDAGVDWQVAVDALYRCVESDLVRLYPCGDGMGQLSRVEYFELMSRSDPDANGTDNWESTRFWVGTYVVGTAKCVELLAAHGLLNQEVASILAKGLRQQAAVSPEMYPNRSFAGASDAISYANLLERCVEVAVKVSSDQQESARADGFSRALQRIFEDCGVPVGDGPIFQVSRI